MIPNRPLSLLFALGLLLGALSALPAAAASDGETDPSTSSSASGTDEPSDTQDAHQGGARGDSSHDQKDDGPQGDVDVQDDDHGFRTHPSSGSDRPSVQFDAANATLGLDRPDVARMTVRIDGALEFVDENHNGAYDLGEKVVARYGLRDLSPRLQRDDAAHTRDAVYDLPGAGKITLRFHLGTASSREGTKYDVVVDEFPFLRADTLLAVGSIVEGAAGLRASTVLGGPAIEGRSGPLVPFLSWVPTVDVDGVPRSVGWSVHVSTSAGAQSAIVYWSYPRGHHLVHDPTVGVTAALRAAVLGDAAALVWAVPATLLVLGIGYALRRRVPL
jgi:hypothetical protein